MKDINLELLLRNYQSINILRFETHHQHKVFILAFLLVVEQVVPIQNVGGTQGFFHVGFHPNNNVIFEVIFAQSLIALPGSPFEVFDKPC